MLRSFLALTALVTTTLWACAREENPPEPPAGTPRLALVIVIDQARADYFERFRSLLTHGIGRLLEESIDFSQTWHDHAITKTATGHASLMSGVHPSRHGVVGNDWYDRKTKAIVKADEDDRYTPERSPSRLLASTLGDWIKHAFSPSRVFTASIKSRAAVTLGGKNADAAFWYDDDTGRFTSSDYYPEDSPKWLSDFHESALPDRMFGTPWTLQPEVAAALEPLGLEHVERGVVHGRLPRPVGKTATFPGSSYYWSFYAESPFADEYLGDFAKSLIDEEALGADAFPDLLALSFSSLDYIGHRYGPNSPEVVDTLVRLDRILGDLLAHLDARVGLEHVVVVLTSDHGVPPVPDYADGRRFWVEERGCVQRAESALDVELGPAKWLESDLVFDDEVLGRQGVSRQRAEEVLASALEACPGVVRAWSASDLEGEEGDLETRLFRNTFFPGRSSDVLLQAEPGAILEDIVTNHGSLYEYDRRVPWLLRVPGFGAAEVTDEVATVDVAPTVAQALGIPHPENLDGRSRLDEAVDPALRLRPTEVD